MTTQDFIIALFYAVDQEMLEVPKHPEATLYPSEVVTLALVFAIKGGGTRAFYVPSADYIQAAAALRLF